jgi:hypothetical protein
MCPKVKSLLFLKTSFFFIIKININTLPLNWLRPRYTRT